MKKVAIFASGNGTNAERIMEYFSANKNAEISLVLTNNPKAGVLKRAKKFDVPSQVFSREDLYKSNKVVEVLLNNQIHFVVLAGFLWLIPASILKEYPNKIINIHPALLPKYGGKGMFGNRVHEAGRQNIRKGHADCPGQPIARGSGMRCGGRGLPGPNRRYR